MSTPSAAQPHIVFSTNQDQAERGGLGLKLGNASAKTVISPDDPPQTDDDNPYRQHCTDNARIWRTYMDQAKISDDNLSNIFNSDLDPLLIFAGLFSAILSAFLIDVRKGLEQDLQSITNTLLTILIENQHNTTGNQISPPSRFTPSSSSRWVNGLWFSSLIFSLMSALGASLAKGWLTQFSAIASGSRWNDVGVHCNRFRGVRRWHLTLIIECLPILIHIAFFLFSIGLIVLVFQDDTAIGAVILVLTALVAFLYIGSSLHPAYSSDSPFRTPLSGIISSLLKHGWQAEQFSPFSDREDVQKAQALAWLLQASPPVDDVMRPIIQAIAGLPATVFVQDELLQPPIIDFLSRTLANELSRPPLNEDHIIPILYALLHLVQTVPSVVNSDSSRLLLALVNTQGPLFATETMGPGIQALALCVKGRIILLYDHGRGQEVFETDIPVLRASTDGHIRHLLTEVQLLSSHSSTGPTRIDLITHLKNYGRRLMHHHKKLPFRVVINDSALTLARLRPTALFVGLGTTSGKVRRKYAKLFKNLVTTHEVFRQSVVGSSMGMELCSLLRCPDRRTRKHMETALRCLAEDDNTWNIVANGFPIIISNLGRESPEIFWMVTCFLKDLSSHDGFQRIIAQYPVIDLIFGKTNMLHKSVSGGTTTAQIIGELTGHEHVQGAVEPKRVAEYLMGLRDVYDAYQKAAQSLVDYAPSSVARDAISGLDLIRKLDSLLAHSLPDVQRYGLRVLVLLAQQENLRALTPIRKAVQQVISMLTDGDADRRQYAIQYLDELLVYEDLRKLIATSGIMMRQSGAMLRSGDFDVRRSGLWITVAILQRAGMWEGISMTDAMERVISAGEDPHVGVRRLAIWGVLDLAKRDADLGMTVGAIHMFLSSLDDHLPDVRLMALEFFVLLANHDRSHILAPETLNRVINLLLDPNPYVKNATLSAILAICAHDDIREEMLATNFITMLVSMLGNTDLYAPNADAALSTTTGLAQYSDFRVAVKDTKMISNIIARLGDPDSAVRKSARRTLLTVVEYDETRPNVALPDSMYQVITTLMHGLRWQQNPSLVEITPSVQLLITLASYEDIYQILSTPRIILYVNSMLEQTNWIPLQFAVETLVALPAPDSGQPHIMNPTVFRKIGAMLEDPRPYVRAMAIRTCHRGKLDEDTTSAAVVMPALIEKISPLLADQSTAVQKSVFEFLAPVLQRASHGGKVGQATGSEIILQHIRSPSLFGDGSTVFQGLLTPVVHGPNSHFIAQTRLTLLNTLTGTDLGRLATLRALGYFATDSILRAEIFTEEIIHAVVLMFDQWALDIYVEAHQTIRNLANYDDVRPRIGTLETVGLLLAALSHNDPLVRILGVQTITDLGRYPDFRNTILTPVARAIVINLANDSNLDVCRVALQGLIEYDHDSARHAALGGYPAFEAYPAVSAFSAFEGYSALGLYSGPIIPKPFAIFCERLTREQPLAQIFAFLEVMASISTHGLMEAICTPQTVAFILKILAMVSMSGKMDQGAELVKFIVENGPLQSLLSTADSLAQILDLVTSFGINDHIIELIKALDTHEPSTAASLVNTIINAISRVSPNVRLSYLILVTTLSPLTTTLTFEHAEQVLRFIEDPDSSIHDSGWRLLKYFAPNEPFRKNISTTLLWESMLRLLHNRPAAMLDVLKVLAEYEDTRRQIVNSASGIVHRLLQMMNAGSKNIEDWRIGVEGLIALNLFEPA